MNSLTLDKALELYEILGAHIPEMGEKDTDALEFIGRIIKSIKVSGENKHYVDAVMLMSDMEWEELKTLESRLVLNLFIDGLVINKIAHLKSFCTEIGFNHG